MALIPHPQAPWLEGIDAVTNAQWRRGVDPVLTNGGRYCVLEPDGGGRFLPRHFQSLRDVIDLMGSDGVPAGWDGREPIERETGSRGLLACFQWLPTLSSPDGFADDRQPVTHVSWYHAKAWTLIQSGLRLLTDSQWEWSAQGGERRLKYSTKNGRLADHRGRPLVHSSVKGPTAFPIAVDHPSYPDGPFGLRHKSGNVWEWVEEGAARGGSWSSLGPAALEVGSRVSPARWSRAVSSLCDLGFRVGGPVPPGCG